ncbi:glycosyl transferase family protein [Novosphingobium sp. 1949]|uniref:Glycosyl transferase family protein n=2 Tax=Novosphingobium organovorum TaxID=2930092 RepID=A0ABT0BEH4_9SPHN|nr:glycosyl transferase family protein [Novosphingobium organovorum]
MAWLELIERELLLFSAFWFAIGALDDMAVDAVWVGLKLFSRAKEGGISNREARAALQGQAAVLIAAWQEEQVIGHTIRHALSAWPQQDYTLYIGCYGNDPATVSAAMSAAAGDPRVRVVIHGNAGPTTKADCLNRLYAALCADERRARARFAFLVLHDSEDMVHPAELAVYDRALQSADYVQLPVRPEPQPWSRWIGGHYCDEFAEAHGKALVVRDALGGGIPAAGVGCAFARAMMERIARRRMAEGYNGPFACECLTEDYELGLLVRDEGGRSRFLRVRDEAGELVATRAFFPGTLESAVRQKSRWVLGIAFQGWDRLGWGNRLCDVWMVLRDRRGPLAALIMACSYSLLLIEGFVLLLQLAGLYQRPPLGGALDGMLAVCGGAVLWRAANRFAFTTAEYGVLEGMMAVLRVPVANIIAIMAGRRALERYVLSLFGRVLVWDKTAHDAHPVSAPGGQ